MKKKKKQKFPQSTHFCVGFSFDFSAITLIGSVIPLLEVLSQGIWTFLLTRWDSNTNLKMHSKDLTAHIKNKQQKERKDGVGKSVWQNGKLKAVGSRQGRVYKRALNEAGGKEKFWFSKHGMAPLSWYSYNKIMQDLEISDLRKSAWTSLHNSLEKPTKMIYY